MRNKVRASTLLEVVVSMVIIILIFGTAMVIYSNVMRLSLSTRRVQAQALFRQIMDGIEDAGSGTDRSIAAVDFRVEQRVKPYGSEGELLEVDLAAFDNNNQQIAELHEIIISHD